MKNSDNVSAINIDMHEECCLLQKRKKIILKEKSINHIVEMNKITHLVCDCYLTTIFIESGSQIIVSKLLKEFEHELTNFGFVRVNRNTMINSMHVMNYRKGKNRIVHLSDNTLINISRRGMIHLKEVLEYVL
jgi:two-component system LytT family response regulator